ncbi:hypothetical protein RA13_00595 [Bacillus atrophaeus]|nr:hypothetical protein RA13_00595 [Bacillus atrophaeus]
MSAFSRWEIIFKGMAEFLIVGLNKILTDKLSDPSKCYDVKTVSLLDVLLAPHRIIYSVCSIYMLIGR